MKSSALLLIFAYASSLFESPSSRNFVRQAYLEFDRGNYDRAIVLCDEAITANPRNLAAYNARGMAYTSKHLYQKALTDFNEALRLDAKQPRSYYNRGCVYLLTGAYNQAINDFNTVIQFKGARDLDAKTSAYENRGRAYYAERDYEKAIADYNHAIEFKPSYWHPYNAVAWLFACCEQSSVRDGRKALDYATKACQLSDWKKATAIDTLAAAYAEVGKFDQAIDYEQRSLKITSLPPAQASKHLKRLALYRQGKPYHEDKPPPIIQGDL